MASEARAPIREADWSTKRSQHGMSGGLEGRSECPGDGVEQLRAASRATHVPVRCRSGRRQFPGRLEHQAVVGHPQDRGADAEHALHLGGRRQQLLTGREQFP